MYKEKSVFLTDGKGGIYKIEKLIKAAVLKNLETGEQLTVEHPLAGFAIINMPKVEDALVGSPKAEAGGKPHKVYKQRKNKTSKYYGVAHQNCKKNPYRGVLHIEGQGVSLGGFPTDIEAAKAVDAALENRGLPKKNFP